MARIRTIKPEFFTSSDIIELKPIERLVFVSLWCEADREGRLKWNPRTLKFRYFPADNCDIEDIGKRLIELGLISIYTVDGKEYAEVCNFHVHQVINNRESDSLLPSVSDASSTRESGAQAEGKGKEGKGKEGKGREPAITRPDNVDEQVWKDFEKLRKSKRAPITQTAIDGIISEADKAGVSLNDALIVCCKNGWQGFNANWNHGFGKPQQGKVQRNGFAETDYSGEL